MKTKIPLIRRITESLYCQVIAIDDKYLDSILKLGYDEKLSSLSYYETSGWKILRIFFLLNLIVLLIVFIAVVRISKVLKKYKRHISDSRSNRNRKKLPDDIYTRVAKAMSKARMTQNTAYVEKHISDEVVYVIYGCNTIKGKENYINYLKDKFEQDRANKVKFDVNPYCSHFVSNHTAVSVYTRKNQSLYEAFRIEKEVVTHIAAIPSKSTFRFEHKVIEPYLNNKIEPKKNRKPCMKCGILSEDLLWIVYQRIPDPSEFPCIRCGVLSGKILQKLKPTDFGDWAVREAEVSICPECKNQIEFEWLD